MNAIPSNPDSKASFRWSRTSGLTLVFLVGYFVVAMGLQYHTGLADNGDFTRSIKIFSPGPVGIRPNFPPVHSDLWNRRFYRYWLPDWTLQRQHERPVTSALLLWLPGVILGDLIHPDGVIDLPFVSLFPRLLLLGELILLLLWASRQPCGWILPLSLGLPAVLVMTTTDNAAYLNSFYQETASCVFVLPFLFSLVYMKRNPSPRRLAILLACLVLLTTGKSSDIYWPLLALPFILYAWVANEPARWRNHWKRLVMAGCAAVCVLSLAARQFTHYKEDEVNPYHSLFYGALTFSQHPGEHLKRLGMEDGIDCIGLSAYSSRGAEYCRKHLDKLTFLNTVTTIAHEPPILFRMGSHVLGAMQDLSLEYVGKYAAGDPRSALYIPSPDNTVGSEERLWNGQEETTGLNLWSTLKYQCFPTGFALALTLSIFIAWFAWRTRYADACQEIALVGLMVSLAAIADMAVAMLGDGRHELIKHLYFSNLLFDMAAIAFLNSVAVWLWEVSGVRRRWFPLPQPQRDRDTPLASG